METRTSVNRRHAAPMVLLVLGLAGCNPVYTIHSVAEPSAEPSPVPDLSGLWVESDAGSTDEVLQVAEVGDHIGQCRNASVRTLGRTSSADEEIADEICFVPVAGHLILQLRTTGQVPLYQQYLFKFDKESISFCGSIWTDLASWSDEHPEGTAAHGLEFTRREGEDSTELFVISRRSELRSYLEATLPQAKQACDEVDEDGYTEWLTYVRLNPPRQPDAADAAEGAPSPDD